MWVAAKCGFTSAAVPVTTQGGSLNLSGLREPFPADKVKQRKGGGGKMLDYVAIETFLERLLDVAPDYTIENANTYFKDDGTAVASLELVIAGKRGYGVGAMKNPDPDMALKSAVSEAIKNAAKNGFGVGLELWNEEYRKTLDSKRALLGGSEAALKREVFKIAREKTGLDKPSGAQVAKAFGRKAGELADPAVLREILEGEGLL